ncbi:MAG TPA: SIS domain-containing protein [Terracidiphilus sp.]|jgi:tagatose-6-phosphate ketose/aldose isomerase|nr:SIS domain-containing protein [Terracidiphilus sp.]
MRKNLSGSAQTDVQTAGHFTSQEIAHQPELWSVVCREVRSTAEELRIDQKLRKKRVLVTGAGSSAYAASAVAAAWPGAVAVPTTDLLLDTERYLTGVDAVISLARSGESPESAAVVERIRSLHAEMLQLAIVCNTDSALARAGVDDLITLDPRTNDRSLVMTSSFSSLVIAGLALAQPAAVSARVDAHSARAAALFPEIEAACRLVSGRVSDRIVVLSSSPLIGWGREAGLKTLEMTSGHFTVVTETFLGLRHGPMSFVKPDTLVLCLLSSDPLRRSYEIDLIDELRSKKIGYLVGIADADGTDQLFDEKIPAIAPEEDDSLRTPYEIVGPQLLGYHLSLRIGLNPDNPSPDGIIHRVVRGVKIHS